MSEIAAWSTSAAGNNATPPNGFPEGMQRKDYNDSARELMAALRSWYTDPEWLRLAFGYTVSRIDASNVRIAGVNLASLYPVGRRVRLTGGGDVQGAVTAVAYSAPDTTVTVDVTVPVGTTEIYAYISATARSGAFTRVGNAVGEIATHSATGPLAAAAYKAVGNVIGDAALHTSAAALATGAYVATGNTIGDLALHSSTGPMKTGAYADVPARAYAKKTADETISGVITVIASLSNIAVPGTPDGVKKYRVNAHVDFANVSGIVTQSIDTLTVKLGAAGTTADTTVLTTLCAVFPGYLADFAFNIAGFEITPAAGNKVSLCLTAAYATAVYGATPRFSWLEIVEI